MGPNVRTAVEAWTIYTDISGKGEVVFLSEPLGLEQKWRELAGRAGSAGNWWTDTYLAALARLTQVRLVTFDQGFKGFPDVNLLVLEA